MADFRELVDVVEENPGDHAARWRLAKKLYMACEYHDALRHLVILRKEWADRLNVARYLAATYYRLGRYRDAISEIRGAIGVWPDEIPLREQLARALEVDERPEEAAEVWREVLALQPDHPLATHTIERLEGGGGDPSSVDLHLAKSDSGIDLAPGMVCPNCGARNSEDFERCWQCHAALSSAGTPTPAIAPPGPAVPNASSARGLWTLVTGVATVAMLCGGVYLTLQHLAAPCVHEGRFFAVTSARQLLAYEWFQARLATGGLLLVAWPAIIWLGALMACDVPQKPRKLAGAGLFLATLTYLILWLPVNLLLPALLAPLLISLVAVWMACAGRTGRVLGVWAMQIILIPAIGAGTFLANTGLTPFREFGAIVEAARPSAGEAAPDGVALPAREVPATYRLIWESTGSDWLDNMGRLVHFEVTSEDLSTPLYVEFREAGQIFRSNRIEQFPYGFSQQVAPERGYSLTISGEGASTKVSVRMQTLFALRSEPK